MEHWKQLGIEATRDKRAIKLAYTKLLKQYPPADFPEEFKALRKAYELATKEAKNPPQEAIEQPSEQHVEQGKGFSEMVGRGDEQPIHGVVDQAFFEEEEPAPSSVENDDIIPQNICLNSVSSLAELKVALNQLYTHVVFRSDLDKWKQLFSAPIFWDTDQGLSVSHLLLEFLIENPLLPKPVYHLVDENMRISSDLILSKNEKCRELAVALKHFIDSLPQRIDPIKELDEGVDFSLLQQHLVLRRTIEEQCIYNKVTVAQLMALMSQVDPLFHDDDFLYLYVTGNLWTLGAYQEITALLEPCSMKEAVSQLGDYLAHAQFMLGHYEAALVLYLDQRERQKGFFDQCLLKEIGLCYLHLKEYKKAHTYLKIAAYFKEEDLERKAALITARRCYIKVLKENDAANAIEIATLQFENGRYQDALLTTQTHSQTFVDKCNYLEALCLVKLGRIEEGFAVFKAFLNLYRVNEQLLWPLLVDLLTYCSDFVDYELLMEVIVHNIPKTATMFHKHEYYPGSVHAKVYSQYELETLGLAAVSFDGEPNKPMSHVTYLDIEYKQYYAWAILHALLVKKVQFEDQELVKNLKKIAVQSIKRIITKVHHHPDYALMFVHLAFDIEEFETCLQLTEIALESYPNSPRLFYYKGRSLAALGKFDAAIPELIHAADQYGHVELGAFSLTFAIECCDKLVALGQPVHPKYDDLCLQLKTTQELIDAS